MMRKQTDFQIADAALCNLAMRVQEWLEKYEDHMTPYVVKELYAILDEA